MTCQSAFDNPKKMIIKASILAYYKQEVRTTVEKNLSNYINSKVFFQLGDDKLLYSIAFFFKNLNLAECNYKIYNKELFAILRCFE